MYIPSNVTPEEILKLYTAGVPDWFVAEYEKLYEKLLDSKQAKCEEDIEAAVEKETEVISEQLDFARNLLEEIMAECYDVLNECRKYSRGYKLAAFIKTKVDSSYFEM